MNIPGNRMYINDNKIVVNDVQLAIGMMYDEAREKVVDIICTEAKPEITTGGRGHIIVKNVQMYDLKGTCTLFFREGKLHHLEIVHDWAFYDMSDDNGNRPAYDEEVRMIADGSRNGLRTGIGRESLIADAKGRIVIFTYDRLKITSRISADDMNYTLVIESAYQNAESAVEGYVFASRRLVDSGCKVGYCYREIPNQSADTGWRFFVGDETQEEVDNPDNIAIYDIKTILEQDPSVYLIVDSQYDSAYERTDAEAPFSVVSD